MKRSAANVQCRCSFALVGFSMTTELQFERRHWTLVTMTHVTKCAASDFYTSLYSLVPLPLASYFCSDYIPKYYIVLQALPDHMTQELWLWKSYSNEHIFTPMQLTAEQWNCINGIWNIYLFLDSSKQLYSMSISSKEIIYYSSHKPSKMLRQSNSPEMFPTFSTTRNQKSAAFQWCFTLKLNSFKNCWNVTNCNKCTLSRWNSNMLQSL